MTELYARARFDDLLADVLARVRAHRGELSDSDAMRIEQEVRERWGGLRIHVGKRVIHDREQVRELLDAGMARRSAYRKVTGK
jgi:hypothetical protein